MLLDFAIGYELTTRLDATSDYSATFMTDCTYYEGIKQYCNTHDAGEIAVMVPNEPYLYEHFQSIQKRLTQDGITLTFVPNTQFLIDHETFLQQFPKKPPVMETFYRWMRRESGVLMQNNEPE